MQESLSELTMPSLSVTVTLVGSNVGFDCRMCIALCIYCACLGTGANIHGHLIISTNDGSPYKRR